MSGEQKPKVEPGDGKKKNYHQNESKFKAPTPGLEDTVFDYNRESTQMSARFTSTLNGLADHVAVSFANGGAEEGKAVRGITAPVYTKPTLDPAKKDDYEEKEIWRDDYRTYSRKTLAWDENNGKIYSLALQHSSPAMKKKLEGLDGYEYIWRDKTGFQ